MKENKFRKQIFNIIICALVIIAFVLFYRVFGGKFEIFKNLDEMRNLILSYGNYSVLAFIVFQMIQVIVFFIPGEVMQIAGGYIFGPVVGSIVSIIGIMLGSAVGFYAAKIIGKKRINNLIEKKNLTKIKKVLDAGSNNLFIFIIYFIPGIPKDLLVYISGISNVKIEDFILYSFMGRLPWVIASAIFGSGINDRNYLIMIVIGIIAVTLFLVGVLRGHKIIDFFHRHSIVKRRKDSKIRENDR